MGQATVPSRRGECRLHFVDVTPLNPLVSQSTRIRAVRNLPNQKELLVIHTLIYGENDQDHILAVYDLPKEESKTTPSESKDSYELLSQTVVTAFHVSDPGIPTKYEDYYRLRSDSHPPPPISIYMETYTQNDTETPTPYNHGIKHSILWPSLKLTPGPTPQDRPKKSYHYDFDHVVPQTTHQCPSYHAHVLPGAFRAILYTVSDTNRTATPPLVNLRRYINPEYQDTDYPIPRVNKSSHIMRKKHPTLPLNTFSSITLDSQMRERYTEDGIAAITWDEGIGRVCMASGDNDTIDILDFAHVVPLENRLKRWQMCQDFVGQNP
jgi:hypothetical protein